MSERCVVHNKQAEEIRHLSWVKEEIIEKAKEEMGSNSGKRLEKDERRFRALFEHETSLLRSDQFVKIPVSYGR